MKKLNFIHCINVKISKANKGIDIMKGYLCNKSIFALK